MIPEGIGSSLVVSPKNTVSAWWVWLCWGALTLLTGGLVLWLGISIPYWDEWDAIVPFITGERAVSWATLWAPHNEHRIAIPRLILLGLDSLTGHEFRSGMIVSLLLLSATSAMLLGTVRKVRGHWNWTDAFFPCMLLNWGHAANLVMSFQVQLVMAGCLGCAAAALVCGRDRPSAPRLAMLALVLAVWPLCSAAGIVCGLAIVPYFAACLFYCRDANQPLSRASLVIAALALVVIPVECLVTYVPRASIHPPAGDVGNLLRHIALEFGMAFGPVVRVVGFPLAAASLGLSGIAVWWLWRGRTPTGAAGAGPTESPGARQTDNAILNRRAEAPRASHPLPRIGLALVIAAHLGLAAAIAWGRSGMGERAVLAARYVTLICPLLVAIYLAAVRFGSTPGHRFVTASLCLAHLALYPANLIASWSIVYPRKIEAAVLSREINLGVPLPDLVRRHSGVFYPSDAVFEHQLHKLHDARIGIFANIKLAPQTADTREAHTSPKR
ncbi:MAG: hypothetical protein HY290_00490 [Planctomycetia bacterium]|nr:hypothetical protein [Planctomycetia bacterium]